MFPSGSPPAAVSTPVHDPRLGFRTTVYPNNKVNFLSVEDPDEHFIAAWVNSPSASAALASFVQTTTIPPIALQRLPIPKFDRDNQAHARLVELARASQALASDDVVAEIDHLVVTTADEA